MSLVDLISVDLSLTKRGKDYWAHCPWHTEKTPSFSVSPEKDLFFCFSCQKGGDSITWLRDYRGLSYQDACKQMGKALEPDPRRERQRQLRAQLEQDYRDWKRRMWRELLALCEETETSIAAYEAGYRSILRAPEYWPEAEQAEVIETLALLYERREIVNAQLDILQSSRREAEALEWWRGLCE